LGFLQISTGTETGGRSSKVERARAPKRIEASVKKKKSKTEGGKEVERKGRKKIDEIPNEMTKWRRKDWRGGGEARLL
jgi:hypothetical protein